jgi:hypothetical protein
MDKIMKSYYAVRNINGDIIPVSKDITYFSSKMDAKAFRNQLNEIRKKEGKDIAYYVTHGPDHWTKQK